MHSIQEGHISHHVGWRSEENLWKSVLSFCFVSVRDQTQVTRLGGRCLPTEPPHLLLLTS